jgi:hypothetical protein
MKLAARVQKSTYGSTYSQDLASPLWPGIEEVMRQAALAGLMMDSWSNPSNGTKKLSRSLWVGRIVP